MKIRILLIVALALLMASRGVLAADVGDTATSSARARLPGTPYIILTRQLDFDRLRAWHVFLYAARIAKNLRPKPPPQPSSP